MKPVPIALVLAPVMVALAFVGRHYQVAVEWSGFTPRRETNLFGVLVFTALAAGWMSTVVFAVGAWQQRGRTPAPWRRVLLAIASVAAWAILAIVDLQSVSTRWLIHHDHFDAVTGVTGLVIGALVLACGICVAFGVERRIAIAAGSLVALAPTVYTILRGPGDTPLALMANLVAPLTLLVLVVRARATSDPDPVRAARGLRRFALGLWFFGALSALQMLGLFVLAVQGLVDLDALDWITPLANLATGAAIVYAMAGALTAADAGVERRWWLAIGMIAFSCIGRVDAGWLQAVLVNIGPALLAWSLARHGRALAGGAVALFAGASLVTKLVMPEFDFDTVVLIYGISCAHLVVRLVAFAMLAHLARLAAKRLEHDPHTLDQVFA